MITELKIFYLNLEFSFIKEVNFNSNYFIHLKKKIFFFLNLLCLSFLLFAEALSVIILPPASFSYQFEQVVFH